MFRSFVTREVGVRGSFSFLLSFNVVQFLDFHYSVFENMKVLNISI